PRFPIVETIAYKSKVSWLKGRPAWVSDYASHYKTSKHFIARSLNGKRNYFKQDVALGDRFNVFKTDREVDFYLVVDTTRSKMWFYYHDKVTNERVLVKSYDVGLGRIDSTQPSGLLTPLGHYQLGEKIAIYKPKQKGWFNNEKVEMIRVFGTRWIPFECEIKDCTAPAKGFGIHGAPWSENDQGELVEDVTCIGKYESDGCVRLKSDDIEEIFSVVITKPTYIVLVKDFFDAQLPGLAKE
ncbi:MAG: L,D-transpeptidase, partial [Chlamydiota bacterium]